MKRRDLTNQRFGRLIALSCFGKRCGKRTRVMWNCQCDCGGSTITTVDNLVLGDTKSCGCLLHEPTHLIKHGNARKLAKTTEYKIWCSMKGRCNNPNNKHYADYGGRGIKVCGQWDEDFAQFLTDVGKRPGPDYTLDRYPNNDSNYEPGNVRWATAKEQANNKRKRKPSPRIWLDGRPLAELSKERGRSTATVFKKWRSGIRGDELFADNRAIANAAKARPRDDMERDLSSGRFLRKHMDGSVSRR